MNNPTLQIATRVLDDATEPPCYAYPGDAGVDLKASACVTLKPFERALVPTSLCMAIPQGYAGFVLPRSGLSSKQGITIVNAPGLIDSNYRGEIKVALINLDPRTTYTINAGDRIAQLVIMATPTVSFSLCESLEETDRGGKGFGSSGIS